MEVLWVYLKWLRGTAEQGKGIALLGVVLLSFYYFLFLSTCSVVCVTLKIQIIALILCSNRCCIGISEGSISGGCIQFRSQGVNGCSTLRDGKVSKSVLTSVQPSNIISFLSFHFLLCIWRSCFLWLLERSLFWDAWCLSSRFRNGTAQFL